MGGSGSRMIPVCARFIAGGVMEQSHLAFRLLRPWRLCFLAPGRRRFPLLLRRFRRDVPRFLETALRLGLAVLAASTEGFLSHET